MYKCTGVYGGEGGVGLRGREITKQLKPGTVPVPAKHLPFTGKPWSYGDVRPDLK